MSAPTEQNRQRVLAAKLLPLARQILERANAEDSSAGPVRSQIRSLMQGVDPDHAVTTVLGMLASAVLDLDGALSLGILNSEDSPENLTKELFRLAYNRWQNDRRRQDRLLRSVERNKPSSTDNTRTSGNSPLESVQKKQQSPIRDAQFRELHDYMVETLDPKDITIWIMYAEGFTRDEIATKINRHRTTVYRKIQRFGEIVQQFVDRPSAPNEKPTPLFPALKGRS